MNAQSRIKLIRLISSLVIISLVVTLLPPPAPTASALSPSLPDYSRQLMSISGTLERDDEGGLRFPYPEARTDSDQGAATSFWQSLWALGASGTSSFIAFVSRLANSARALPTQDPAAPAQGGPVFLPIVNRANPQAVPLGEKAVFQTLLPSADMLAGELGFSPAQTQRVQAVIDAEAAAIADLDAEAADVLHDGQATLQEKRAAIAAMDYNGRLRAILRKSQDDLRGQLGGDAYARLVGWLDREWRRLVEEFNSVRSQSGVEAAAIGDPCPTYTVFATRSIYTDLSADLPDVYISRANRGIEYSHGYTSSIVYSITVQLHTEIMENLVITDVAPHNHDDNYWNANDDPLHPRRLFTDLPQGLPEAEAAYFNNYNNGLNQFGQVVTNPAGVNVSETAAQQLGMIGNDWVDVTYQWDCTPDEQTRVNRIERSWGSNDWSQSDGDLINPVTGNQALWQRDLYVPAPGLPVDIVRYYNSRDGADGIFGRGWSSELDMRVYPQEDGSYKVRYADGRRATFRPSGGGYVGEPGDFDTFAADGGGYVLTLADEQITYRFGSNGRLRSIEDLNGNRITLSYTNGNPTTITDSAGRNFTLTYDGNGHVTRIEDPMGRVVTYGYSEPTVAAAVLGVSSAQQEPSAQLNSVTDPDQGTTRYEYDPATQAMTRAIDGDGIPFIENLYDEQGRVRQQRNAKGETGELEYDEQNRRSVFTDKLGNRTIYVYDSKMRLVRETDALGNSVTYTYNDRDQMIAKTDKRGFTWRYAYDERGNLIRREDPIDDRTAAYYTSDVTTFEYNARNLVTRMTDALGNVTRYEYDDRGNLTRVIEPNGATTVSTFNSKGQMTSLTDAEGNVTRYEYDADGNRTAVIDAEGGVTRMTYDDAGRVLTQTDPNGNTTTYEYDGNGNVTKITDPLGNVSRLEYNRNGLVTQEIDRRGAETTYRYDDDLNLVAVTDPLGYVTRFEYDAMHNRTKLIDANGNVTTYGYDDLYRITRMTDPLGATTRYEYDANGNVISTTDALGNTTRYEYDAMGRRISVTDPLGNKTELVYDQLDRVTQTIDPLGAVSRYEYDAAGNLVRITNPLNGVTTHDYDLIHNRIRTTDPNGHTSTFTYDGLGREIARTDGLGRVVRTEYDRIGNTTAITDANGGVITFEYNANSWPIRTTDMVGAQFSYTYDEEGNQVSATDANGHTTRTTYNLRGDVTSETDPLGNTTRYTHDANGNVVTETDANGHVTHYEYGAGDLLLNTVDALNHPVLFEYDLVGRPIRITDANGKTSTYEYDALDRVTAVADAKGEVTRYRYDARGNLASIIDANGYTTRFEYNALNLVVKETNALGKTWLYSYDGVGNLVEKVDGKGQVVRYEYDAADQLIRKSFPDGKSVIYDYDRNGNRVQMVDWNGTSTATYDAVDQLTSVTDHKGRRLGYSYDGMGNVVSMIYPDDRAVRYHYDARDLLIRMDDPNGRATLYAYDLGGRMTSQVRPNNTRTDFTYDDANYLTSVHSTGPGGAIIGNFDYTLDSVGNRTQVVATRPDEAPVTYTYGYDDNYQLVSAHSDSGQALSFAYDAVGNRQAVEGMTEPVPPELPSVPISTTYQYNEIYSMVRAGNARMSYDDNGNRIRSEQPLAETEYAELGLNGTLITDYTFDVEDRLVEVRETLRYLKEEEADPISAVVMEADYSYDGNGRRIAKLVQTYNLQGGRLDVLLREYVYDDLDVAVEYEYHNGATTPDVTYYYYANGEKVSLERTNADGEKQVYWYAYDAQGTTTALLDAAGEIVAEYQSDEFGRLLTGNSDLNHYLFTGQEYDLETGLYHFFARYYDPDTGVWLSQDVQRGNVMYPATWHRYAYVLNNPVNTTDPLGYWPDWLDSVVEAGERYVVEPAKKAWNATKEVAKDAADAVNQHVIKPVVRTAQRVKDAAERTYERAKRRVVEAAREFNDNYIKPAREKAAELARSAREGITKAADWVQEHKDTVAMIAGTVGAIAAGAAFCGATAGIGCLVIAGVAGGALAAGAVQAGANVLDSSANTGLLDNVGRSALFGGVTGGLDALTGGLAGRALSAARPLLQRGATALAQRAGSVARSVGQSGGLALARRGGAALAQRAGSAVQSAGAAARRAGEGLRRIVGRGCRSSFSGDTLVMTANGAQPISTIQAGDRVLAYHAVLGETDSYTVTATINHVASAIQLLTIDDEQLETTLDHSFLTRERGWVEADELWIGAHIYRADGRTGVVQEMDIVPRQQPMYNLTVEQAHTFFVGDGHWLAHNAACFVGTASRSRARAPRQGIYAFYDATNPGKIYVGQSSNIRRRLRKHFRRGRFQTVALVREVRGGKLARETAEQNLINALGGIGGGRVSNVVNPIGPDRVTDAIKHGLNLSYPFYP